MKEMSAKKIVLASIAFLASALLFTGMLFSVIKLDVGFNMELEAGLKIKDVQWFANGYDMLSFELPAVLKTMITQLYAEMNYEADLTALEVISGIFSVLTLVAAVAGCVLTVISIFCFSKKASRRAGTTVAIVSVSLALAYTVVSIVFVSVVKSQLKDIYSSAQKDETVQAVLGGFKTNMFVSLIFQAVLTVAYFVCAGTIRESSAEQAQCADTKACVAAGKNKKEDLLALIEAETRVIGLLREYKKLCDESVMSGSDYSEKKIRMLRYSDAKLHAEMSALVRQSAYADTVKAEEAITAALRGYKQLADDGIISEGDFIDKKASLLSCVMNG